MLVKKNSSVYFKIIDLLFNLKDIKMPHGPTELEPRTSRLPCELKANWATEPHGRRMAPCYLLHIVEKDVKGITLCAYPHRRRAGLAIVHVSTNFQLYKTYSCWE